MKTRLRVAALVLAVALPWAQARAGSLTLNLDLVFDTLTLSGQSTGDDAPALGDGWTRVDSSLQVQLSGAAPPSTLTGSLGIDAVSNTFMTLTGTFYLDLLFEDIDAAKVYGASLGNQVLVQAAPLVVGLDFGVDLSQLSAVQAYLAANPGATIGEAVDAFNASNDPATSGIDDIAPIITDNGVKMPLGVDLNNADGDDAVQLFGSSLLLTMAETVAVDLTMSDTEFAQLLADVLAGADVALDIAGSVDVTASDATLTGGIVDLADPPFTFENMELVARASTPASVPEPLTLALLGAGLVLAGVRRRLTPPRTPSSPPA